VTLHLDPHEALVTLRRAGTAAVLCTVVRTQGSTPRKAGAAMVVTLAGLHAGTIGGGRVENEVLATARELLVAGVADTRLLRYHLTHELAMCCGGEMEVFLELTPPAPLLVVCGGGHVARALVPLARTVGFAPVVVEDLPELVAPGYFPADIRVVDSFDVADWELSLGEATSVVVVTRDHATDFRLLEQLLDVPLGYLGLIGSRRKIEMFRRRLEHRGRSLARWPALHAPIGLPIGAQTPEEIAVAIVAELISVRHAARRSSTVDPATTARLEPERSMRQPPEVGNLSDTDSTQEPS